MYFAYFIGFILYAVVVLLSSIRNSNRFSDLHTEKLAIGLTYIGNEISPLIAMYSVSSREGKNY